MLLAWTDSANSQVAFKTGYDITWSAIAYRNDASYTTPIGVALVQRNLGSCRLLAYSGSGTYSMQSYEPNVWLQAAWVTIAASTTLDPMRVAAAAVNASTLEVFGTFAGLLVSFTYSQTAPPFPASPPPSPPAGEGLGAL